MQRDNQIAVFGKYFTRFLKPFGFNVDLTPILHEGVMEVTFLCRLNGTHMQVRVPIRQIMAASESGLVEDARDEAAGVAMRFIQALPPERKVRPVSMMTAPPQLHADYIKAFKYGLISAFDPPLASNAIPDHPIPPPAKQSSIYDHVMNKDKEKKLEGPK